MGSPLDLKIMTEIDDLHENLVFARDLLYDSVNQSRVLSISIACTQLNLEVFYKRIGSPAKSGKDSGRVLFTNLECGCGTWQHRVC